MTTIEAKAELEAAIALEKRAQTPGYHSNAVLADARQLKQAALADLREAIGRIASRGGEYHIGGHRGYWWETGNTEPWSGRDDVDPGAGEAEAFAETVLLEQVSDCDWEELAVECYRRAAREICEA